MNNIYNVYVIIIFIFRAPGRTRSRIGGCFKTTERFRTRRRSRGARRAVRLNSPRRALGLYSTAVRLPAVSHPAVAGRRRGIGSYRSHPWRFWRAINRASTMGHPALVGISGFMLVRYCKH